MEAVGPEVKVRRPVYQLDELQRVCDYTKPKRPISTKVTKKCKTFSLSDFLKRSIPLVHWLPKYNWKNDIAGDFVAGFTVAIMHIPQGMAYAILGNVSPVIGIYMAFFPVLVYLFLGTSKHNSMGTFAVVCLMTGKVVSRHSSTVQSITPGNYSEVEYDGVQIVHDSPSYSATEVATAVTFTVGIFQLAMHVLRLGVISTLLSDTLVSGFTTGAAIHVLTSQIKDLFGLKLPKRSGIFKIVMIYYDLLNNIENLNVAATVISTMTVIIVMFNNEVLKVLLAKKCAFPIPIEMLVVLLGTIASVQMNMSVEYGITTVGDIPVGLPKPTLPRLELIPDVIVDSLVITMVSYTITMSMALIFAQRNNYEVDSNQELMAQGAGNLVGSFFSCMPFTASLSRSLIQEAVGGRSQLASLISCCLLLSVLLWIGPFFEPLPRCILASIIIVSLKGMLLQVKQLWKFWCLSRVDAAVWMVTFLTVVFLDIEYGLLAGMFVSLASLLAFYMRPYVCIMGLVPGTEIFLDVKRYRGTVEIPGVKMLHYCGGLNFASRISFRNEVYKVTGVVPRKELIKRSKLAAKKTKGYVNEGFDDTHENGFASDDQNALKVLILDFSALTYVDPAGVGTLRNLIDEYNEIQIFMIPESAQKKLEIRGKTIVPLYRNDFEISCLTRFQIQFATDGRWDFYYLRNAKTGPVYETMRKCNTAERKEGHYFTMFPTIGDAVNFALHERASTITELNSSSMSSLNTLHVTCNEEPECSSRL